MTHESHLKAETDLWTVFPSDMSAPIFEASSGKFSKDKIPAERPGTPEDMAGTILFLASRAGAYCDGTVVITDGGRLSVMPATY